MKARANSHCKDTTTFGIEIILSNQPIQLSCAFKEDLVDREHGGARIGCQRVRYVTSPNFAFYQTLPFVFRASMHIARSEGTKIVCAQSYLANSQSPSPSSSTHIMDLVEKHWESRLDRSLPMTIARQPP